MEVDDASPLPERIRRALIEDHGLWTLNIAATGTGAPRVLLTLREALGLSVAETGALRARLPGEVARGTNGEMELLRRRLARRGVDSAVTQVGQCVSPCCLQRCWWKPAQSHQKCHTGASSNSAARASMLSTSWSRSGQ